MSGFLNNLFQTVTDAQSQQEILVKRRYGVIEVVDQTLIGVHLRPFPKTPLVARAKWDRFRKQRFGDSGKDRIRLFYNQPMMHKNFLALAYFVSDNRCSLPTVAVSLSVLDYIAKAKRTDAIVAEISNPRIADRHLEFFGWERHMEYSPRRHWIKRFYGEYPEKYLFLPSQNRPLSDSNPLPIPACVDSVAEPVSVSNH